MSPLKTVIVPLSGQVSVCTTRRCWFYFARFVCDFSHIFV